MSVELLRQLVGKPGADVRAHPAQVEDIAKVEPDPQVILSSIQAC
jgi:hypothetical protein